MKTLIIYTEMVRYLMNHRDLHLVNQFFFVFAHLLKRTLKDRDFVRKDHPVTLPFSQHHTLVQTE